MSVLDSWMYLKETDWAPIEAKVLANVTSGRGRVLFSDGNGCFTGARLTSRSISAVLAVVGSAASGLLSSVTRRMQ